MRYFTGKLELVSNNLQIMVTLISKKFLYFLKRKPFLYFEKWNFLALLLKNFLYFSKIFLYLRKRPPPSPIPPFLFQEILEILLIIVIWNVFSFCNIFSIFKKLLFFIFREIFVAFKTILSFFSFFS